MKCCKILRSLDRVFVYEFVKCLCIGAPSKDPARFVDLGFWIFEKQEAQAYKRVPKKQTTTPLEEVQAIRRLIPSALAHRTCWRSCTSYQETEILLGEGLAPGT